MEKRYEYVKQFAELIIKYTEEIDIANSKIAEAQPAMKTECLALLKSLEKERFDFIVNYGQLKNTHGHKWDETENGNAKDWLELDAAIEKAGLRFK